MQIIFITKPALMMITIIYTHLLSLCYHHRAHPPASSPPLPYLTSSYQQSSLCWLQKQWHWVLMITLLTFTITTTTTIQQQHHHHHQIAAVSILLHHISSPHCAGSKNNGIWSSCHWKHESVGARHLVGIMRMMMMMLLMIILKMMMMMTKGSMAMMMNMAMMTY